MFNEKEKNVTSIWLEYNDDFKKFYNSAIHDIEKYSGIKSMHAKGEIPPNFYDITSIPWVSFTNFQINMYEVDGTWLAPFVAIGRFFEQNGKILLPVHITVHHATCDGYHVGMFFKELQELCLGNWI
jgi:chloramphenicol O-acetyltransferase type A